MYIQNYFKYCFLLQIRFNKFHLLVYLLLFTVYNLQFVLLRSNQLCLLQSREVPWKSIASSKPFIAMCVCAFAKGWVFNMLLMQEPTYMNVFGFSIAQVSLEDLFQTCQITFAKFPQIFQTSGVSTELAFGRHKLRLGVLELPKPLDGIPGSAPALM